MSISSREIRLKSRPVGVPTPDNFEIGTVELPDPAAGEVQVKNLWMTVDPYMRGRMNDVKSYTPPFQLGEAMQGGAIGEVIASNDPSLKAGDLVAELLRLARGVQRPGRGGAEARHPRPAAAGVPGRRRHAGPDRLCRPAARSPS